MKPVGFALKFWMPLDKTNLTALGIQEQLVFYSAPVFCFETFVHIVEEVPNIPEVEEL